MERIRVRILNHIKFDNHIGYIDGYVYNTKENIIEAIIILENDSFLINNNIISIPIFNLKKI